VYSSQGIKAKKVKIKAGVTTGPEHPGGTQVLCVAQLAERRSLAGELTLSYARPAADG